jgi:hypothetical protein
MAAVVKGTCAFRNRRAQQRGADDLTNVGSGANSVNGLTASAVIEERQGSRLAGRRGGGGLAGEVLKITI